MTLALSLLALLLALVGVWLFIRGTRLDDSEPVRDCQCREQAREDYYRQSRRGPR